MVSPRGRGCACPTQPPPPGVTSVLTPGSDAGLLRIAPAPAEATITSMPEAKRQLEFLQAEVDSAFLYRTLAELESDPALAELYERLAATEERHAQVWHARLAAADGGPGMPQPTRRARILAWLARRFGPRFVLPSLSEQEDLDQGRYDAEGRRTPAGWLPRSARTRACFARSAAASRVRRSRGSRVAIGRSAETPCGRPCSAPMTACSRTSAS